MAMISFSPIAAGWADMHASVVDVVREHARRTPDRHAFTFLDYASEQPREQRLGSAQFDSRARQVAALLQSKARPGSRVLLSFPSGPDFLVAFFGCLYAGMVAVPAYPALNPRLRDRVTTIAQDCDAAIILTTAQTLSDMGGRYAMPNALACMHWMTTDGALDGLEHGWRPVDVKPEQIAFLQYTSGSSGTPKGVMVTHRNLLHNLQAIALHMELKPHDHGFSWLPPYHDMGLIGALLTPLAAGIDFTFMTPHAFLRRPARWLREIAARGCTISGAPNFAFEMCLDKIGDDELATLDLSRWAIAFTGAEPVKLDSMDRFARRFAACGFNRDAFYPCYGMAETTLMVTGKHRASPFTTLMPQLQADSRKTSALVSCGVPAHGLHVRIVDPVDLSPLADGETGEIAVAGASVAAGYWKRELETLFTFGLNVDGDVEPFLRTGDLGFLHRGELYVCARLKDVVIVRGVNHYPQDIETTVDGCHEAIRPGCGICFSVEQDDMERMVFVQEIARRDQPRAREIVLAIRSAIVARHDIQAHAVVLVESGTIHKTTSGKLARRPCRVDFLDGALQVIERWEHAPAARPHGATVD